MATETRDPRATAATIRSRSGTLAKCQRRLYKPSWMSTIVRTARRRPTTTGNAGRENGPVRRSNRSASARYAATTIPRISMARRYRPRTSAANRKILRSGGVAAIPRSAPTRGGSDGGWVAGGECRFERRTANVPPKPRAFRLCGESRDYAVRFSGHPLSLAARSDPEQYGNRPPLPSTKYPCRLRFDDVWCPWAPAL